MILSHMKGVSSILLSMLSSLLCGISQSTSNYIKSWTLPTLVHSILLCEF